MSEIELLDNEDVVSRYDYDSDNKANARRKYDVVAMQLVHDCLTELGVNSTNIKAAKDVKEIAGTLEVLTRTAYRILDIPPAKEDPSDNKNSNLEKLMDALNAKLGGDGE